MPKLILDVASINNNMTTSKIFSDIDLSFQPHPVTGDLLAKYDENAIKTSIRNLVLTRHYERPFRSAIGSNVYSLLFELEGPALAALVEKEITDVIENFEPRVEVIEVTATLNPDRNSLTSTVKFRIKETMRPLQMDLIIRRVR